MQFPKDHFLKRSALICALLVAAIAASASARESIGIFGEWGAFIDTEVPRCYAIAKAAPSTKERQFQPYATISTWPKRGVRNQFFLRLSRKSKPKTPVTLRVGTKVFTLSVSGANAWANGQAGDAGIAAQMRSANEMVVRAVDLQGGNFTNTYTLKGAATAIDAALVACAKLED